MTKGLIAAQHHVEHDACAPDVDFFVVFTLSENFRRAELHRASLCDQLLPGTPFTGYIEIQDVKDIVGGNE